MSSWLYILRLKSGSLYVGAANNLEKRYEDHCSGTACLTTKIDPPVLTMARLMAALVHSEKYETFTDARKREAQVKHWSRSKKEALIVGDMEKLQNLSKSRK